MTPGDPRTPYAPPGSLLHDPADAVPAGMRWMRILVFSWITVVACPGTVLAFLLLVDAGMVPGLSVDNADSIVVAVMAIGALACHTAFLWPVRRWRWRFANAAVLYVAAMLLLYALVFSIEVALGQPRSRVNAPWPLILGHALVVLGALGLSWPRRAP